MEKKRKHVSWFRWPLEYDQIPTSGDSRYPSIAEGEFTVWSEDIQQLPPPDGGWEIFYQRDGGEPVNLSRSANVASRFSNVSRRQLFNSVYLYVMWTEGNAPPYTIVCRRLTFSDHGDTIPKAGGYCSRAFYSASPGLEEPSIYTVERTGYIDTWAHSVDYGDSLLIYRFPYLDPRMTYEVEAEFYHEGPGTWGAGFLAGGHSLGGFVYPEGELVRVRAIIPPEAYADSSLVIKLRKTAGDYVALAGLKIFQYEVERGGKGGPMSHEGGDDRPLDLGLEVIPGVFRGGLEVVYRVPCEGEVVLEVYDVSGRRVRELVRGDVARGEHRLEWDGRDGEGRLLSSGVYFVSLEGMGRRAVRKVVLVR